MAGDDLGDKFKQELDGLDAASVDSLPRPIFTQLPAHQNFEATKAAADSVFRCAKALGQQVSATYGLAGDDVWHALTHLPDPMLLLLGTPDGWGQLGAVIASQVTDQPCSPMPVTLH